MRKCPICHSSVPLNARKCRHCHNFLGFSFQWLWEEMSRVLGLIAMVAAAVVAWKSLELTMEATRQRDEAVTQTAISHQEHDALKEDLVAGLPGQGILEGQAGRTQAKSILRASEKTSDLRVRKVLALASQLQGQGAHFVMGGKSPEEGFDSSGFISYLLAKAGALDPLYYRTFSVARLEKTFPAVKPDKAKPGDLVFLGTSFVALDLGENLALGIGTSKGIQVFSFSPKAKKSFRRWAYEQDAKMAR